MLFRSTKLRYIYQCQKPHLFFLERVGTPVGVHWPPGAEIRSLFLVGYPRWVALRAGITSLRHIGAESSHSNKVVIRRLSYLDIFLILFCVKVAENSSSTYLGNWCFLTCIVTYLLLSIPCCLMSFREKDYFTFEYEFIMQFLSS